MESIPTGPSEEDLLNKAFPNPDLEVQGGPLVDEIIHREIRSVHSLVQPSTDHWRNTRKLFGNDFEREYNGREQEAKFREQRLKAKRSKRQP